MDYKSILSYCSLPLKTELSEGTEYRENLSLTLFLTALNNIKLKVCTNYTYSPGSKREKKIILRIIVMSMTVLHTQYLVQEQASFLGLNIKEQINNVKNCENKDSFHLKNMN